MSRYEAMFQKGPAFIPFVMLGDVSLDVMDELIRGGADALELGIPFSDPVADGPVIQRAAMRAIAKGTTLTTCLKDLATIRNRHPQIPIGILTYANIVVHAGLDEFYSAMSKAGVDSVLVADVPTLEAKPFCDAAIKHGVDPVMIAPPNADDECLKRIAQMGRGYTYVVTRAGVTGSDEHLRLNATQLLQKLKQFGAPPAVLGFGISTPAHVKQAIEAGAAGAISGSVIVARLERAESVEDFVREMKQNLPLRQ